VEAFKIRLLRLRQRNLRSSIQGHRALPGGYTVLDDMLAAAEERS
jgi:hypothetical protein